MALKRNSLRAIRKTDVFLILGGAHGAGLFSTAHFCPFATGGPICEGQPVPHNMALGPKLLELAMGLVGEPLWIGPREVRSVWPCGSAKRWPYEKEHYGSSLDPMKNALVHRPAKAAKPAVAGPVQLVVRRLMAGASITLLAPTDCAKPSN
jgi:hypothetical protein